MIDLVSILNAQERVNIEVKAAGGGIPNSIWETYSSFANTFGGTIILGIEEDKHTKKFIPKGVSDPQQMLSDIWNTLNNRQKIHTNILLEHHVYSLDYEGMHFVVMEVPRADRRDKPVYIGQDMFRGTFRRNHEGDYHCSEAEVKAMLRDQTDTPQDALILEDLLNRDLNQESIHRYRIMFCGTLAHELDLELGLNRRNVCRLANPEPFLAGIRAIAERMLADDPADAAELSAMAYTLITGFAAELSRGRELDVPEPLGRIVRGIRANPSGEKPVRRLAEENGMEIHMLMRLFRKHLGVSPLEYRNRLRIEEAKRHLAHSTLSMKEIAERLGYRNALYFSTAFRKRTGVSPSLYRKRSRETLE